MLAQKNRKLKIGLDYKNAIHLEVLIKQETEITFIISSIYKLTSILLFFSTAKSKITKYMYQKFDFHFHDNTNYQNQRTWILNGLSEVLSFRQVSHRIPHIVNEMES